MRIPLPRLSPKSRHPSFFVLLAAVIGLAAATASAQVEDQGTSVEGCVGCHALGRVAPVGDIDDPNDLHFVDTNPLGPLTDSTYRQLHATIMSVDLRNPQIVVEFTMTNEQGQPVENTFDSDGTLVIAKLVDGVDPNDPDTAGNPTEWQRLVNQSFTADGGSFQNLDLGNYRYTSTANPASPAIEEGDSLRVLLAVSADDIPTANGWCDFDASLTAVNTDCVTLPTLHRDIVQTTTCNGCHGVTSDTQLTFHNPGRATLEYCVMCHNPPNIGEDMTNLAHKIHYGSSLTQPYRVSEDHPEGKYSHVTFTRDIGDCTSCHEGAGVDVDNWKKKPTRSACDSCHDDIDWVTGVGHGDPPRPQLNDRFCIFCHPSTGEWTAGTLPVPAVHQGVARAEEAGYYRGEGNGYALTASFDRKAGEFGQIIAVFSVTRDGQKMDLATDDRWTNDAGLGLQYAWSTDEITNEGSGSTPAPAQPVDIDVLTELGPGGKVSQPNPGVFEYRAVIDVPTGAFDTVVVALDGHPTVDLRGNDEWESVPVRNAFSEVNIETRGLPVPRRHVIDIAKCNLCHDYAGAGLSLHGENRTGEMQVCVLCHNNDATDIRQRPVSGDEGFPPVDGKLEESIDIKRMIHQIHAGKHLTEGLVIYGYMKSLHDFRKVGFTSNLGNCLTCHDPGTYSTDDAWHTFSSTVDTGADVTVPTDDLNISSARCPSRRTCSWRWRPCARWGAWPGAVGDDAGRGKEDPAEPPGAGAQAASRAPDQS
ncbi:MAG: OmcA/MtrC family decaheme c-type cytochrome [Deltaproteobacteria bacterium]|nr:OmcA/MtrC family decaheme c-type cytochrome [Deltaproteobacteria bacterium]